MHKNRACNKRGNQSIEKNTEGHMIDIQDKIFEASILIFIVYPIPYVLKYCSRR